MTLRAVAEPGLAAALADALAGGPAVTPGGASSDLPPWPAAEPAAGTALVVATSGTTGRPRGVELSAAALRAAVAATHQRLGGPGVWTCALPLSYVAGLMTVVRSLIAGQPHQRVGGDLAGLSPVAGSRNYLSLVAAQLHRAVTEPTTLAALRRFDAVLVGGSATDPGVVARARAAGVPVITTYGMTETCGGCVYDGRPLDGVQVDLADDGLITLAGPMLFTGYLGEPEATARALRGGRFRTSDRGQWADDGRLRVTGRADEVVISGGVNVDLAAAQRAVDAIYGPGRTVLLAVPDERFGVRIVAVTTSSEELDQLRERLTPVMAPHALPRALRWVDRLPLTRTGKIDRVTLTRSWADEEAPWRP